MEQDTVVVHVNKSQRKRKFLVLLRLSPEPPSSSRARHPGYPRQGACVRDQANCLTTATKEAFFTLPNIEDSDELGRWWFRLAIDRVLFHMQPICRVRIASNARSYRRVCDTKACPSNTASSAAAAASAACNRHLGDDGAAARSCRSTLQCSCSSSTAA